MRVAGGVEEMDRRVVVNLVSVADLESRRAQDVYDRFVCRVLSAIVLLCLLGSVSVALLFAYFKFAGVDDGFK